MPGPDDLSQSHRTRRCRWVGAWALGLIAWASVAAGQIRITDVGFSSGRHASVSSISSDGRWIAFETNADFLGEGRPAEVKEIWLADTTTGELQRLTDSRANGQTLRDSRAPSISADGQWIAFYSDADFQNEGIERLQREIWLINTTTNDFFRLTDASHGQIGDRNSHSPSISANGRRIAFISDADLLHEGHAGEAEVWLWDVSLAEAGQNPPLRRLTDMNAGAGAGIGSDTIRNAFNPSISADGRWITFNSDGDFLEEGRPDNTMEIWLADVESCVLTPLTSAGLSGFSGFSSSHPSISADGSRVVFYSEADLDSSGEPFDGQEIFLWERGVEGLRRLTLESGAQAGQLRDSVEPVISADGRWIAFESDGDFLGEGRPNNVMEIWLANADTGELRRLTDAAAEPDGQRDASAPTISADGRWISFYSDAPFSSPPVADMQREIWLTSNPALVASAGWVAR
jgi:Tol biopolymer transport system component